MQDAFGIVIFAVVAVAVVVAVVSVAGTRKLYEQIGRGGLSLDREEARRAPGPGTAASLLERDQEIRQLLTARNARRARRGEAALDIEAEIVRLTAAPAVAGDPALVTEVRQLVVARNQRRLRAGQPALDVEAEVARQMRELGV